MMRWLLRAAAIIVAALVVATLIGWRMPRSHRASREQVIAATPESIWAAITAVDAFPSWRPGVETVQRLDRGGQHAWIEDGDSGRITFVIERTEAPRLLITRIADPELPFGGTWTYEIAAAAQGTRVRITEDGEIYNPLFRFVARFVFGYEQTMASYLEALEKRVHAPHAK